MDKEKKYTLSQAFDLCLQTKGLLTGTGKYTAQQVWGFKNRPTTTELKRVIVHTCGFRLIQRELYVRKTDE